jgi:hypothetical protein
MIRGAVEVVGRASAFFIIPFENPPIASIPIHRWEREAGPSEVSASIRSRLMPPIRPSMRIDNSAYELRALGRGGIVPRLHGRAVPLIEARDFPNRGYELRWIEVQFQQRQDGNSIAAQLEFLPRSHLATVTQMLEFGPEVLVTGFVGHHRL